MPQGVGHLCVSVRYNKYSQKCPRVGCGALPGFIWGWQVSYAPGGAGALVCIGKGWFAMPRISPKWDPASNSCVIWQLKHNQNFWQNLFACVALPWRHVAFYHCHTLRMPWSNCYRTATASELIWLRRNVTRGRFSNLYQGAYFACTNLANHRCCTKLLTHWQWHGRSRCGLGLLQNTQSFWSQLAHTAAYRVCWAIQP